MNKKYFFKLVLVLFFLSCFICACSLINKSLNKSQVSSDAVEQDENIFKIKILEKIDDGDRIYILGEATSREEILVDDVRVKIRLMGERGDLLGEQNYNFSSLTGKDISKTFQRNVPKRFLVSINPKNLKEAPSDYQLELSWGQDENGVQTQNVFANAPFADTSRSDSGGSNAFKQDSQNTTNKSNGLKMSNLFFEKKLVSPNDKEPKYYFVISGDFENLSDKIIKEISIAVSFKSKLSSNRLNNDEEFLEIKDISLAPHSSKKFEMELETVLSSQDANIYKPDIKIVSFN